MTKMQPALQDFVKSLAAELSVDVCSLYLPTESGNFLELVATYGLHASVIGTRIPKDRGLVTKVARTRRVVAVKDPESHPDYYHVAGSGEEHYRTFLGIPIARGADLAAVLVVQTKHSHMYLLEEIAKIHETGRRIETVLAA